MAHRKFLPTLDESQDEENHRIMMEEEFHEHSNAVPRTQPVQRAFLCAVENHFMGVADKHGLDLFSDD